LEFRRVLFRSFSMSATSISVVGSHCNVLGISPGQMRHAEPSLSSTIWLLSCFLICIVDLPCNRSELWMYQGRKDTGHPQRLLERLLGRRTDALTNFFTNLGIVLRHLQNGVVFLQREALVG